MFRFLVFIMAASVVFISCEKETEIVRPNPELTMSYADFRDNAPAAPSANPLSYACYEFTSPYIFDWIMIKQQEIGLIIHGSLVYQMGTNVLRVYDPTGGPGMSFESDNFTVSQSQAVSIQDARDANLKPHILFDCPLTDYTPEWFVLYVDPDNTDVGDTTYQSYGAVTLNIDRMRGYAWVNGQLTILNDSGDGLSANVSQPIMFFDTEADANAYRNMTNFRICLRGDDDFMTCVAELSVE